VVGQVASQQLPEPTTPEHNAGFDLGEQCVTTAGHVALVAHAVTPSSQTPFVQVPGVHSAQVTKPDFPQVERATHRMMLPLQFTGSPFATACFTWWATQLTYWPWLVAAVQEHVFAMLVRTAAAMAGLSHFAAAVPMRAPDSSNAVAMIPRRDVMSTSS